MLPYEGALPGLARSHDHDHGEHGERPIDGDDCRAGEEALGRWLGPSTS